MIYRKAKIEDISELVKLRVEFLKEVQTALVQQEKDEELEKTTGEYYETAMKNESFISWIAVEDGKVVGTSGVCFYSLPPSYKNLSGKTAYIMNMYTIPGYRGRGIADSLFKKIVSEAQNKGCTKISLHATEMGRPVYLKNGFTDSHGEMVFNTKI